MTVTAQTIEQLKQDEHFFAAGALAHSLGYQRQSYGCHFGMRSTVETARETYCAGWDAASKRKAWR